MVPGRISFLLKVSFTRRDGALLALRVRELRPPNGLLLDARLGGARLVRPLLRQDPRHQQLLEADGCGVVVPRRKRHLEPDVLVAAALHDGLDEPRLHEPNGAEPTAKCLGEILVRERNIWTGEDPDPVAPAALEGLGLDVGRQLHDMHDANSPHVVDVLDYFRLYSLMLDKTIYSIFSKW
jgi:hypothetical protein